MERETLKNIVTKIFDGFDHIPGIEKHNSVIDDISSVDIYRYFDWENPGYIEIKESKNIIFITFSKELRDSVLTKKLLFSVNKVLSGEYGMAVEFDGENVIAYYDVFQRYENFEDIKNIFLDIFKDKNIRISYKESKKLLFISDTDMSIGIKEVKNQAFIMGEESLEPLLQLSQYIKKTTDYIISTSHLYLTSKIIILK